MDHGFLYIDKPSGMTSYDVIRCIKRLLPKGTKIGHAGTLDPLATGLLILGIGREATREFVHTLKLDKEYEVIALLGVSYTTLDVMGELLEEKDPSSVTKEALLKILTQFSGEMLQIPPMYSALKHKGKKLYELAREGKEVERTPRKVVIHEMELLSFDSPRAKLRIRCSSGTYIRTLVDDIGKALGVGAAVEELRRTSIGTVAVADAIPLEKLTSLDEIKKSLQSRD